MRFSGRQGGIPSTRWEQSGGLEIDYTEYNEVQWVTIDEARVLVTDPANLLTLDRLEKL